jgi:hypothetical protein
LFDEDITSIREEFSAMAVLNILLPFLVRTYEVELKQLLVRMNEVVLKQLLVRTNEVVLKQLWATQKN